MDLPSPLTRMLIKEEIPHALLFTGANGSDCAEVAEEFAQSVLALGISSFRRKKDHPDLHRYHPEGKSGMHTIAQIRSLIDEIALFPFEAKWRVFILYDAERMPSSSANALLKTFEEPTPRTLILLLSTHPDQLLPTVLSRCQVISLSASKTQERSPEETLLLHFLCSPRRGDYLFLKENIDNIHQAIESAQKKQEKGLLEDLSPTLSPMQKETFENEIQGLLALQSYAIGCALFETILEWARDLTALMYGSSLIHEDCRSIFETYLSSHPLPDLLWIEERTRSSKLALERSSKLSHCLESLLLSLEL